MAPAFTNEQKQKRFVSPEEVWVPETIAIILTVVLATSLSLHVSPALDKRGTTIRKIIHSLIEFNNSAHFCMNKVHWSLVLFEEVLQCSFNTLLQLIPLTFFHRRLTQFSTGMDKIWSNIKYCKDVNNIRLIDKLHNKESAWY